MIATTFPAHHVRDRRIKDGLDDAVRSQNARTIDGQRRFCRRDVLRIFLLVRDGFFRHIRSGNSGNTGPWVLVGRPDNVEAPLRRRVWRVANGSEISASHSLVPGLWGRLLLLRHRLHSLLRRWLCRLRLRGRGRLHIDRNRDIEARLVALIDRPHDRRHELPFVTGLVANRHITISTWGQHIRAGVIHLQSVDHPDRVDPLDFPVFISSVRNPDGLVRALTRLDFDKKLLRRDPEFRTHLCRAAQRIEQPAVGVDILAAKVRSIVRLEDLHGIVRPGR